MFPPLWIQFVPSQYMFQSFIGCVNKEIYENILGRIRIRIGAITDYYAVNIPNIKTIPFAVHDSLNFIFIFNFI